MGSRLLSCLGVTILLAACASASGQKPPGRPGPEREPTASPHEPQSSTQGHAESPATPATQKSRADELRRAAYPKSWEVPVPKNTKLDELRKRLDKEIHLLPRNDLDDQTPIPIWFRVYLRKRFPDLEKSGPYQYPRTSTRILQRLLDNPDSVTEGI